MVVFFKKKMVAIITNDIKKYYKFNSDNINIHNSLILDIVRKNNNTEVSINEDLINIKNRLILNKIQYERYDVYKNIIDYFYLSNNNNIIITEPIDVLRYSSYYIINRLLDKIKKNLKLSYLPIMKIKNIYNFTKINFSKIISYINENYYYPSINIDLINIKKDKLTLYKREIDVYSDEYMLFLIKNNKNFIDSKTLYALFSPSSINNLTYGVGICNKHLVLKQIISDSDIYNNTDINTFINDNTIEIQNKIDGLISKLINLDIEELPMSYYFNIHLLFIKKQKKITYEFHISNFSLLEEKMLESIFVNKEIFDKTCNKIIKLYNNNQKKNE